MADTSKIVIELKSVGSDSVANGQDQTVNGSDTVKKASSTLVQGANNPSKETMARNMLIKQAVSSAVAFTSQVGQYHISKYFALREDYESEQTYQNGMAAVEEIASFGSSVANGAILGSFGGPIGAVIGAGISAVAWTVKEVFSIKKNWFNQQVSINTSNTQTGYSRVRLGLTNDRGETNQ